MTQMQIEITADSRRARQEFDSLERSIRSTGKSLVDASGFLGNLQSSYRGLSDVVRQGDDTVDAESRRADALRQSADAAKDAQRAVSGYVSSTSGSTGAAVSFIDRISSVVDNWLAQEYREVAKTVAQTAHKTGTVTVPDSPYIASDERPPAVPYNMTPVKVEDTDIEGQLQDQRIRMRYQQLVLAGQLHERQLELDGKYDELALEQLQTRYEEEMDILSGEEEAQLQLTEQYELQKDRIRKDAARRETQRQMQIVAGTAQMFGNLARITAAFGKSGFQAWKRLSEAQAVLDGVQAMQSAYAWGMKYGGPLLAMINVGIAAGVTAANVASIESQNYAEGGMVAARVSNGEFFVEPSVARRNRPLLEMMRSGTIRGPGTGRSDSIPALLPSGSFILPADATQRYQSWLPGLAVGGWVDGGSTAGMGSTGVGSARLEERLDRLGQLLEGVQGQLRAMNGNLARQQPVITVENRSRDIETVIRNQDYRRNRMIAGGYDGRGENLAL
jgi:hypothetical protein